MTLRQADIAFQANLYESENPTRKWLHGERREWVLQAIHRHAKKQGRFLEVGVGCGIYTRELATLGEVTGIDINPEFISAANKIPNVVASIGDVQELGFHNAFDVALCSEVIEHVPDSRRAIHQIGNALKPGGVLILTTPNSFSTMEIFARLLSLRPIAKLASLIYREPVDDLGHINRLTRSQLELQIHGAGFKIRETADLALYLPVFAEFGGRLGRDMAKKIATLVGKTPFRGLLWTQCYVLERA